MNTPRFLKIAIAIILLLLLILLFEWPNIESQYKGETMIETSIDIDNTLNISQKHIQLDKIYKIEKELKGDVLIVKYLLAIFTVILFVILHRFYKIEPLVKKDL